MDSWFVSMVDPILKGVKVELVSGYSMLLYIILYFLMLQTPFRYF